MKFGTNTRIYFCFHSEDDKSKKQKQSKSESGGILSSLQGNKVISLSEARQIFDIPDGEEPDYEMFGKKWKLLRENNNPEKGGSAYLLAKITNAKKRLEKEYGTLKEVEEAPQAEDAKPESKEREK